MPKVSDRIRSAARLLRRDPSLVLLGFRVYVLLVVMRVIVTVFPMRRITSRLGHHMGETPLQDLSVGEERFARRVAWCVARVAPYTPTRSNCYPQALTAWWLLHRRRIPTTYYYGATFVDGREELAAHVWLRAGRLVVTGARTESRFVALASYADEPGAA